ncbi:MFS transporter [Nocardiopsis dassonvillei]|jgi:MFS family permease|uniref:MFS transporter n=1 Tax=Nocardiopsis dassonvillei TaxID=2014 RepID=UPI0020A4B875|nr:MFS transporter [Nocardiopsis dassonvillei]MCP3012118.1 MFS transporter [Nocardiopsis dassonvillei]
MMARTQARPPGRDTGASRSRLDVVRWQVGYGMFGVPQAAAPIAFALVALPITGTAESGAGLVFAMTAAQVLGAVPVSRLGRRFNGARYLRALIAVRTLALVAVTVLAAVQAPFGFLLAAVTAAGAVNGAAYGYQRLLLNHLVEPSGLPRALGVAATLNEVGFALSPVLASVLGAVSPVWAMAAVTALGVGPLLLMPRVPGARGPQVGGAPRVRTPVPRAALLWLLCATASSGAVAAVEVGAVSFALAFGLEPGWAFLFALVLCAGSVAGGVWVSVRNRTPAPWQVIAFLAATTAGSGLVLVGGHLSLTLTGAAVIGLFLPMLGTFYSLALDELAPPDRRAEMFALLRTASSLGVIAVSGLLALLGLRAALVGSFALLLVAACLAAAHHARSRGGAAPRAARDGV